MHFPILLKASGQVTITTLNKRRAIYATLFETLKESFVSQFRDLQMKRPQITFLFDPFNFETDCLKTSLLLDEAASELEMINLCEKGKLKPAYEKGPLSFEKVCQWKNTPISNELHLRYSQCLSQHTSASLCFLP